MPLPERLSYLSQKQHRAIVAIFEARISDIGQQAGNRDGGKRQAEFVPDK